MKIGFDILGDDLHVCKQYRSCSEQAHLDSSHYIIIEYLFCLKLTIPEKSLW